MASAEGRGKIINIAIVAKSCSVMGVISAPTIFSTNAGAISCITPDKTVIMEISKMINLIYFFMIPEIYQNQTLKSIDKLSK